MANYYALFVISYARLSFVYGSVYYYYHFYEMQL